MFDQFQDLWHTKWDRHKNTEPTRWHAFESCVNHHVRPPDHDMPYHRITPEQWIHEVRRKKSSTAVGPDGVAKADLLNMPPSMLQKLLDMIWHIENGSSWPRALLTGLITAIEKKPNACKPSEFRPICVLSLTYRTWASLRVKQILAWLARHCPDGLIGNRARKETAHIWWTISAMIERAWYDDEPISGGIGDIVKCYTTAFLGSQSFTSLSI